MRCVDGNYLFQTIMQKWFDKISAKIDSNDKNTIANELIKIIGLEGDEAVTPENIIALSEGKAFANNHLAKCLTAAVPTDILVNTPFNLSSRANFYSFAISIKNDSIPIIEASQHPTTYPFGEKVLRFKERLWQLRIERDVSMRAVKRIADIDIKSLANWESPYKNVKNIIYPIIPDTENLIVLQNVVESIYNENWLKFRQDYYLPALWEYNLLKEDKITESQNPYVLMRLYLKSIPNKEEMEFFQNYKISQQTIKDSYRKNWASAKSLYAPQRSELRKYFAENIKNPESLGIPEDFLDRFFPIPHASKLKEISDFKNLLEAWRDVIGISQLDFGAKIDSTLGNPRKRFNNWSDGTGLDNYLDKICNFIRTQTENNTELPRFAESEEQQLREIARIKQKEYREGLKQKRDISKSSAYLMAILNSNSCPELITVQVRER